MAFDVIHTMGKEKNPAAQALGRLGGLARKTNLSSQRLSEIGKKGARVRWPNSGNKVVAMPTEADKLSTQEAPAEAGSGYNMSKGEEPK